MEPPTDRGLEALPRQQADGSRFVLPDDGRQMDLDDLEVEETFCSELNDDHPKRTADTSSSKPPGWSDPRGVVCIMSVCIVDTATNRVYRAHE